MPDNETSIDIVIRTRAELDGTQAAEAALERDIAKARELGQEYAAQDGQSLEPPTPLTPQGALPAPDPVELQTPGPETDTPDTPTDLLAASNSQPGEFQSSDARAFELQSESVQAAGDSLRAALELNGQMTLALLNRTLQLIEEQNRQLGDMDRQLSQLAGQIKGLKNP